MSHAEESAYGERTAFADNTMVCLGLSHNGSRGKGAKNEH